LADMASRISGDLGQYSVVNDDQKEMFPPEMTPEGTETANKGKEIVYGCYDPCYAGNRLRGPNKAFLTVTIVALMIFILMWLV